MPEQRAAFVSLALSGACTMAEACRRFGISRPTGYKWLARATAAEPSLEELSRRPHKSPSRSPADVEAAVLEVRDERGWGARKIHAFLRDRRDLTVPARTISAILRRHGLTRPRGAAPVPPSRRFERAAPNELWQVDFKGPIELAGRRQCHLLSVLDDHSRYLLALEVAPDKAMATAWAILWELFAQVGMPERVLADNGFASPGPGGRLSVGWFDARLIRLGVGTSHGRPYHPQTQGKVERLHGTLESEILPRARRDDERSLAEDLRSWRVGVYNALRPHESLGDDVPASRWRPSERRRPGEVPPVAYPPGAELRKVMGRGEISWRGREILVGCGITGERVRVEDEGGEVRVYYADRLVRSVRLEHAPKGVIM